MSPEPVVTVLVAVAFWVAGMTYKNPRIPRPELFKADFTAHTSPTTPWGVLMSNNRDLSNIRATVSTVLPREGPPHETIVTELTRDTESISSPIFSRVVTCFFADLRLHTTVNGLITAPCVSGALGAACPCVEMGESSSPRLREKRASLWGSREGCLGRRGRFWRVGGWGGRQQMA